MPNPKFTIRDLRNYQTFMNYSDESIRRKLNLGDMNGLRDLLKASIEDAWLPEDLAEKLRLTMKKDQYPLEEIERLMTQKSYKSYTEKMGPMAPAFDELVVEFNKLINELRENQIDRVALYYPTGYESAEDAIVAASTEFSKESLADGKSGDDRPVPDADLEFIVEKFLNNSNIEYDDEEGVETVGPNLDYHSIKRKFDDYPFAIVFISATAEDGQVFRLNFFLKQTQIRTAIRSKMESLGLT